MQLFKHINEILLITGYNYRFSCGYKNLSFQDFVKIIVPQKEELTKKRISKRSFWIFCN
jgi:hypothetical protein